MEFYIFINGFDFSTSLLSHSRYNILRETTICDDSHVLAKTVCEINVCGTSGSGVVIATRDTPHIVNGKPIYALVLTASHVIGNILRLIPLSEDTVIEICFQSSWDHHLTYEAFLIKDFSSWTEAPQRDLIMGENYVLPCNLAIIGVTSQIQYESSICDTVSQNDNVTIVGYPKQPGFIEYCAPFMSLEPGTVYEKYNKIENAFCGFKNRVLCDGVVLSPSGSDLICGNYSGTSGMSGSPVFIGDSICGINVGGAALKYQYEIGNLIGLCQINEWTRAEFIVKDIIKKVQTDPSYDFSQLTRIYHLKSDIKRRNFNSMVSTAASVMQMIAIAYKDPLKLSHNVALSCTHPAFRETKAVCLKFKSDSTMFFSDRNSFYNYLIS